MKLPPPFSWLWLGWLKFSEVLGFVMSRIILTVVWVVVIGIYAIVIKLLQMPRHFSRSARNEPVTYWVPAEPVTADSLKHQF